MRRGRDLRIRGYTVGQAPNPPLWAALGALVVALIVPAGWVEDAARAVLYVALSIWAYEELTDGVNAFRRALGAVALVLIVVGLAAAIG